MLISVNFISNVGGEVGVSQLRTLIRTVSFFLWRIFFFIYSGGGSIATTDIILNGKFFFMAHFFLYSGLVVFSPCIMIAHIYTI